MDNKKFLLVGFQAMVLGLTLAMQLTPIALIPGIVAFYAVNAKKKNTETDREVLLFVKDVLRNYGKGPLNAVRSAASKNYSFSQYMFDLIAMYRLGSFTTGKADARISNSYLVELYQMVMYSLSTGANIRNSLVQFEKRLDARITVANRMRSKVGGMQYITYMGMAFFLPLFGGISSTILATSMGILNQNPTGIGHGFIYAIAAYILSVLVIDTFFSKIQSRLLDRICSIVPLFSISVLIMTLSASYVTYAI